jgi:hypothetical protein
MEVSDGCYQPTNAQPDYYSAFKKAGLLVTLTKEEEDGYYRWIESFCDPNDEDD